MARTCTICTHPQRNIMDALLLRGEALNAIARRFSVSSDALFRHRKHMQTTMAKLAANADHRNGEYGSSLLAEVARIRSDAERLQHEYESRRDLRGALRAIETRLSVIELAARFTGQIEVKQKNELHLHFTPDRALAVAEAYVSRHGPEKPIQLLPPDPAPSEIVSPSDLEESE
jgi:predicted DNA-binding protein YlxM (UPF0122 family)